MTEPETIDIEAAKVIGDLPPGIKVDRDLVTGAIGEKLKTFSKDDFLKAIKFSGGEAIKVADEGLEFLASASVEPNHGTASSGPPMRARVLNVIVTVRGDDIDVKLPFYSNR